MKSIRKYWTDTLRDNPALNLSIGSASGSRVLISPIGTRPGVLYSALLACRGTATVGTPDRCLVLCSAETEHGIDEAVRQAGFNGEIVRLRFEDPYGGISEIKTMEKKTKPHLVGADPAMVNITGGTTLMGLAADALAKVAGQLACPVRRFGLIDRQPPEKQGRNPYRKGEAYWLDAAESATDAD